MLFKKLLVAAVLVIQASAAAVSTLPADESARSLESRASPPPPAGGVKLIEVGSTTGTAAETLWTRGLDTCPGIVASGKNSRPNGVTKVLGHIEPTNAEEQLNDWVKKVHDSGMTDIKVLLYVLDPTNVPQRIGGPMAQKALNDFAKTSAMKINAGFTTIMRSHVEQASPADQLRVDAHGNIYAGGRRVL